MTVGCWYNANVATHNHHIFSLYEAAGFTGWEFYISSDDITTRLGWWTGSATQGTATCTSTRDGWNYIIGRLISTSNKRIANLSPAGPQHAVNTSSTTPGALTTLAIGVGLGTGALSANRSNAFIAEWFMTDTDIQPDGLQLSDDLLWQLAFRGPWSVPHVARSVIEYRSFRTGAVAVDDSPSDTYQRGNLRAWSAVNGPLKTADGPPISTNYVRPNQVPRLLVI